MSKSLNPDSIYTNFKNGDLDKSTVIKRLISIIENDTNGDNRVKSIKILGKIDHNNQIFFEFLENLLISDSNEHVRGTAANIILQNYFDIGSKAIEWALKHEFSPKCLSIILRSLEKIDSKVVESYIRAELNQINQNQPEIIKTFWDLDSLPYSLDWKIEIFVKCKFLLFLKENYKLNRWDYEIIDEEFKKISIRGKFKKISEIKGLEMLTELEELDLSYNHIEKIDSLEKFPHLKRLNLEGNQISKIKGLNNLEELLELNLSRNRISEIKGLENLRELRSLDLSHNNIAELKGLDTLSNLEELNLLNNNIKGVKKPENLKKLLIFQY